MPRKFLSTLSLRRATLIFPPVDTSSVKISIHALLAESDGIGLVFMWWGVRFLSTLSLRRATTGVSTHCKTVPYFYPRSPCGERHDWPPVREIIQWISIHALLAESDIHAQNLCVSIIISIHALLAESDRFYPLEALIILPFLSTLSLRRATNSQDDGPSFSVHISIHALLAESDETSESRYRRTSDFYPRSPCGERQLLYPGSTRKINFYPRSPCGERLRYICSYAMSSQISIHALLAESDQH